MIVGEDKYVKETRERTKGLNALKNHFDEIDITLGFELT